MQTSLNPNIRQTYALKSSNAMPPPMAEWRVCDGVRVRL